jgi:hypothetical protein
VHDENHKELKKQTERRSTQLRKSPGWFGNPVLSIMLTDHDKLATYTEAMEGPESEKWLEAMKFKIKSMYDNQVWTLVDIPSNRVAIENKWIFKKNTDGDSIVIVYNARLLIKGFRQIQSTEYDEMFSPVAISGSISYCCLF